MPWICFAIALGCFALAMNTQSMGFALLLLLAALGLMVYGALALAATRIQSRSQSGAGISLNPALERQRLAQQRAEAATVATPGAVDDGGAAAADADGRDDRLDS